jgi:glucose-6-phosphate-specific signal transduction histidine kinase
MLCTIEDNGIGRKLSEPMKSDMPGKKSQGIKIVRERLKIMGTARRQSYSIIIEDLNPEKIETGTRISISLPIKIEKP